MNKKIEIKRNLSLRNKCQVDIDMGIPMDVSGKDSNVYYNDQKPGLPGIPFIDEVFPPDNKSIVWLDPNNEVSKEITENEIRDISGLEWKRPDEIYNRFDLYKEIDPEDINQGRLGNCYFLSSVSALAEFSQRIKNIFYNNQTKTENGCYTLKLYIQGKMQLVTIDDHLPCVKQGNRYTLAFATLRQEIWVQLLEKAWAKICGSYAMTIAGLPSEALSCLTEAPTITYIHKKYSTDDMWEKIHDADKKNYIICTCTSGKPDIDKNGLVAAHAYTIIDAFDLGVVRLVKVRNPWGGFEWNGDYSDKSSKWTSDLKRKVDFKDVDDGTFFMSIEDFLKFFPYTFVCKYEEGYTYNYREFFQVPHETMTVCKLQIKPNTRLIISLHQKQQRFYREVKFYKPDMSRIILCKYHPEQEYTYTFIDSFASCDDKLHLEVNNLEPGEYHVYSHVDWEYEEFDKCSYVISTYSNVSVLIEDIQKEIIPDDFMHQIFYSYLTTRSNPRQLTSDLQLYDSFVDNNLGFYMMLFRNVGSKHGIRVGFTASHNDQTRLMTRHQHTSSCAHEDKWNTDKFSVKIKPNCDYLILYELLNQPWHSKLKIDKITYSKDDSPDEPEDPYRKDIEKVLGRVAKSNLNGECLLAEIEFDSGLFLVFQNCSKRYNYKFKVSFDNLFNLDVAPKQKAVFRIQSKEFAYILLNKKIKSQEINYELLYNYKKY